MAVTKLHHETIATLLHLNDDVDTTPAGIKVGDGTLYSIELDNSAAGVVNHYKMVTGAQIPTPGTTAPEISILLPAGARVTVEIVDGLAFTGGLSEWATTLGGTAASVTPATAVLDYVRAA